MHDAEIVFKGISMLRPLHENVLGTLTAMKTADSEHGIGPVFQKIAPYFKLCLQAKPLRRSFSRLLRWKGPAA